MALEGISETSLRRLATNLRISHDALPLMDLLHELRKRGPAIRAMTTGRRGKATERMCPAVREAHYLAQTGRLTSRQLRRIRHKNNGGR